MKDYRITVSPKVGRRFTKIAPDLAALGVKVEVTQRDRRVERRYAHRRVGDRHGPHSVIRFREGASAAWTIAAHAWLAFQILKTTIGSWPKISKLLQKAGLKRDEIITLGLQDAVAHTKKRRASRKRANTRGKKKK